MDESLKLRVSELDFSEIKNNFKKYLKTQDYFKDIDFEGSTINSLLDILAYNTHYNSYYLNMVANEMFLDSAVLRSSLISLSKMIGYKPRSRYGAVANVSAVIFGTNSADSITLPKKSKIFSTIDGISYSFVTTESYTVENKSLNPSVTIPNILIKEGEPLTYSFVVDTSDTNQRFILPNRGIDSSTVEVYVQESSTNTRRSRFTIANDILDIGTTSNVYFIEDTTDFYQEIRFGDGVLGRKLISGNIVIVDYNICSGVLGNGANTFFSVGTLAGFENSTIITNSSAIGGNDEESLESIRFNAPRQYSTQNRAVTLTDYKSIITRDYNGAQSVSVFGGESTFPPQFGRVFIAIRPKQGLYLTSSLKERIKNNILKRYNIASITPEFIDVDYMNIVVNSSVQYNSSLTSRSIQTLSTLIKNNIINYSSSQLETFDKPFIISALQRYIDNTDTSILGNDTKILLKKEITLTPLATNYEVRFNNPLHYPYAGFMGTITSSYFSIYDDFNVLRDNCRLENRGSTLRIYNMENGNKTVRLTDVGNVDLNTGFLQLFNFSPTSITGNTLDIFAMPDSYDIKTRNEQILMIKPSNIQIKMNDISTNLTTNVL